MSQGRVRRRHRWAIVAAGLIAAMAPACGDSDDTTQAADSGAPDATFDASATDARPADTGSQVGPDAANDGAADAGDAESDASDGGSDASDSGADASDGAPVVVSGGVYVGQIDGHVTDLTVDANGDIAGTAKGSPFATGVLTTYSILAHPTKPRVYAGGSDGNSNASVVSYSLDAMGVLGAKQSGSPFATGVKATPTRMAMNPSATRLYVAHQGTIKSLAVFAVGTNGDIGSLRPGSPFSTSATTSTYGVTVNPAGTRLYVTSQEAHGVFVFALDANGDITGLRPGSPFKGVSSDFPIIAAVHPSGSTVYVADQAKNILVFALDANGDITGQRSGSPVSLGGFSAAVAVNAGGTRLYVVNDANVTTFPLDPATGAITGAGVSSNMGLIQAHDLALGAAGRRMYLFNTNTVTENLAVFLLDASGNISSLASGSPFTIPGNPTGIAVR